MKKYIVSFILMLQIFILSLFLGVLILRGNFAYAEASEMSETADMPKLSAEGAPASLKELQEATDEQLDKWTALEKFDGRDYGYVTKTKNQNQDSICWAYASAGVAEASILREGFDRNATTQNLDFDERHLAWSTYNRDGTTDPLYLTANDTFEDYWNKGGLVNNALTTMTQGYSPIPQQSGEDFKKNVESEYIVENLIHIERNDQALKQAILKYGAVCFSYKAPSGYPEWFYETNPNLTTDHASIIVGWDDSISRNRFSPNTPNRDGAWIVKNSWGVYGEPNGGVYCFYLSYDSYTTDYYTVDMAFKKDYENIYYYDGFPINSATRLGQDKSAAIYEAKLTNAKQKEQLSAVVVGVIGYKSNVNVDVYRHLQNINPGNVNSKSNNPEQGTPYVTKKAYFESDGVYTINLDSPIDLDQGEYFSIVISGSDQYNNYVQILCAADSYQSINDMTYLCYNGEWKSYKDSNSYANSSVYQLVPRIRAITKTVQREQTLENDLQYARVEIPNRLLNYVRGQAIVPQITVLWEKQTLVQDQDYFVEVTDNTKPGKATVTLSGKGIYFGTRATSFEVAKPRKPEGAWEGTIDVYNDITELYDIELPPYWQWVGTENYVLKEGRSDYPACVIYKGEDADCYQNIYSEFYVNKINQDPPEKIDLSGAVVTVEGSYSYIGKPIIPTVKVLLGDNELIKDFDYTLRGAQNTDAGSATVIVEGIRKYKGQTTAAFTINKAKFPFVSPESEITVTDNINRLSEVDLNAEGWTWLTADRELEDGLVATAIYNDRQNFENFTINITIRIVKEEKKDIGALAFDIGENSFVFDGKAKTLDIVIKEGSYTLVLNQDYEVTYRDNTYAGRATAVITGKNKYTGSKEIVFDILRAERDKFKVEIEGWTYGQTSAEPTCLGEEESANIKYEYGKTKDGRFSDIKPENAGTYFVRATIEQSRNYNGKVAYSSFTVSKASGSMSATIENWTFGETAEKPKITSATNITSNPSITYKSLNLTEFTSAAPTDAGVYQMKIVLPESENYNSCELILTFEILRAQKPENIPQTVNVPKNAKVFGDIALPTGWKWENPNQAITKETKRATIVRIDEGNYIQAGFEIELNFEAEPEQQENKPLGLSALWWGLGAAGGITVICLAAWLILKRKKMR